MEELLKDLQVLNPEQRKRLESLSMTRQHSDNTSRIASPIEQTSSQDNTLAEQQVAVVSYRIASDYYMT